MAKEIIDKNLLKLIEEAPVVQALIKKAKQKVFGKFKVITEHKYYKQENRDLLLKEIKKDLK